MELGTRINNPEAVDLSDMIINVCWSQSKIGDRTYTHGIKICHIGEFENAITLADIKKHYPRTFLVIAESPLEGRVYRYGNHGEYWEYVGRTIGYA